MYILRLEKAYSYRSKEHVKSVLHNKTLSSELS